MENYKVPPIVNPSPDHRNLQVSPSIDNYLFFYTFNPKSFMSGVGYGALYQALSVTRENLKSNRRIDEMIKNFEEKAQKFCQGRPNIHSVWVLKDKDNKTLWIKTVLADLDFDSEYEVFQDLYGELPVTVEGYYVDKDTPLFDEILMEELLSKSFTQIFPNN